MTLAAQTWVSVKVLGEQGMEPFPLSLTDIHVMKRADPGNTHFLYQSSLAAKHEKKSTEDMITRDHIQDRRIDRVGDSGYFSKAGWYVQEAEINARFWPDYTWFCT